MTSQRLRTRFFGFFRAWMLRILCASWRKQFVGLAQLDARLARGEKVIAVLWHGKYFTLLPLLRNRYACVFTSLSSRGNVIDDLLCRFGFKGVQIPDHGGSLSFGIMRNALADGTSAVIAVDGPLGPYHEVHRGAVQLASELGHLIVPVSVAVSHKRTIYSRWDNLELPRLFSRVHPVIGDPLHIPSSLDEETLKSWITIVHDSLDQVDAQANRSLADCLVRTAR